MNTTEILLNWYKGHKRDLPWRRTRNPYYIWISEVILQQTRVEQGLAYYYKFIEKFPAVQKLASAKESEVLKLWQGLGYYSRARNMHAASKEIVNTHKGIFPKTYDEIIKLKGVGEYTAAAISSFAFQLKYPVLDGNVFRFLSRYFGIRTDIQSSGAKKEFLHIANELLADYPVQIFNQAIMEFGALQCKPASPDCLACPLHSSCYAFENNMTGALPVKNKKQSIRNRYFYYLVVRDDKSVYIQQRKDKDIWQNLFEFPLIETNKKINDTVLQENTEWKKIFKNASTQVHNISGTKKHVLSHQVLHAKFVELKISDKNFEAPSHWEKVKRSKIRKYAIPRLIDKYIEEQEGKYSF